MKHEKFIVVFVAAVFLHVWLCISAIASEPHWGDVPHALKQTPGAMVQGNWIYATGDAMLAGIRPDKAHELSRQKSHHRALQWLRINGTCNTLAESLPADKRENFFNIFLPFIPPVHVAQLRTIRQWESDDATLTVVAAPVEALSGIECPFPDLNALIRHYIEQPDVSLTGLMFCLNLAPRYSALASHIRAKTGRFLRQQTLSSLSQCFLDADALDASGVPLMLYHQIHQAEALTRRAAHLAENGKWPEALDAVETALSLAPLYSPAYLLLGQYLLHENNQPNLALEAAQKALRGGCCFKKAMELKRQCLMQLGSDEAEIYAYLLKKAREKDETAYSGYPFQLDDQMPIIDGKTMADLVVNSAGSAVATSDQPPDPAFERAVALFQGAGSDADIHNVLELLFEALSRQPASAKTHNLIGACLRHLNQPGLALPFLWQAVNLKPDYDLALANLGICCAMLGQKKSASYYFSHPAVMHSDNQWVKEQINAFKRGP